ncbi:MAG: pseudouridine synthase, RluA family [Firmicutes bacterium]|nr:pseudouridine synthase, RluA family [Bacillota bacterium]
MLTFRVPDHSPPILLRDFLRKQMKISLTAWRKIKREGTILRNGTAVVPGSLVQAGDCIDLEWPQECHIQPIDLPLTIHYEDDFFLLINKPAGILVHPTCGNMEPTIANGVMQYYKSQNYSLGFHPIHRLDRNTSGLLLIAKAPHVQHLLSQTKNLQINRRYHAIAAGILSPEQGTITLPIGRRPGSIIERIVCPEGKEAITDYRLLQKFKHASLLEIELHTGRTHQIRVHMSHLQHPLLGDDLYGGSRDWINRPALHSAQLELIHPITGKNLSFFEPLPADMQTALETLAALEK